MSTPLAPDTRVTLAENVAFRPVGDTGILLNTVSGQIHTCNESARDVVALITRPVSANELSAQLTELYEAEQAEILPDVMDLLTELTSEGMVTSTNPA
ncbi:MAG: PqqD family protein [Pseudomonadota bacterium]